MNTQQGLHTVDVADANTDANPFCEPLTLPERALLAVMLIASLAVIFGVGGYLFTRFNIA